MNRQTKRTNYQSEVRRRELENVQNVVGDLVIKTEDDDVRDKLFDVLSTVRLAIRQLDYKLTR